jgi:alanine dehydrogenase
MRIGVAKEIKPDEYRVALTTAGVTELVRRGHDVLIERSAARSSSRCRAATPSRRRCRRPTS